MAKKKTSKKKAAIELTLWDVILSYPDLNDPKPYKGKIYYKTDVLFDKGHPDLVKLREAIDSVCVDTFGEDDSEWPESIPEIKNGNEREDSKGYAGRRYITASTQTPVPVVNPDGDKFNPKMVKGGMFANVAVRVSAWEFDGDEGVSIYLQGVQIDTDKEGENFGGGKSVKKMFDLDDEDESPRKAKRRSSRDEEDEEDEAPKKSSRRAARDDDEEDEKPRRAKRSSRDSDEDEEDEAPRRSKKRASRDEDEEDEAPRRSKKKASRDFDDDEEDEKPRRSKKRSSRDDDEDESDFDDEE